MAKWSKDVAMKVGWEQHRYGNSCVQLVRAVLPQYERLHCSAEQPNTPVVPCIFADLDKRGDWTYALPRRSSVPDQIEVQRSRCMFSAALHVAAMEMVLSHGRSLSQRSCQILIMSTGSAVAASGAAPRGTPAALSGSGSTGSSSSSEEESDA